MEAAPENRASAQGWYMIMTNGCGAYMGGVSSGFVVDLFTKDGVKDWPHIWLVFAAYALVLVLIFPFLFKYKHERVTKVN